MRAALGADRLLACGLAATLALAGCQRSTSSGSTGKRAEAKEGAGAVDGAQRAAAESETSSASRGVHLADSSDGTNSASAMPRLSIASRDQPRSVSQYLYGERESEQMRRAWMRSSASFVLSREAAKNARAVAVEDPATGKAATQATKLEPESLRKLVVLEAFADGVRTMLEISGARLVLYVPRDALWPVPTTPALVGVSAENATTLQEHAGEATPGRVLHAGVRLDWSEERDGALRGSFSSDEIAFDGWVALKKLGYVFVEEPTPQPTEASAPALVRPGTVLSDAPRGEKLATLGLPTRKHWIEIRRLDQESRGWNLIELSTRDVTAHGWVPISALSAPGELYGLGRLGTYGSRAGGGSSSTTWVFLPRGTKLLAAPKGEVVGITLRPLRARQVGEQQVRVGADELVPALTVAHDVVWASKRVLKRQKALDEVLSVESREKRAPKRGGLLDDAALAAVRRHARDCLLDWAMQRELHGQSWDGETGKAVDDAAADGKNAADAKVTAHGADAGLPWALPAGTFTLRSELDGLRVSHWRASGPSGKLANCLETLPLRPGFSADAKKKLRKLEAPVAAVILGGDTSDED